MHIIKVGTYYYWVDSDGMLRKHNSKPPSADSTSIGTIIG